MELDSCCCRWMFCSSRNARSLTWIIVVVPIDLTGSCIDVRCEQQHCEQRQIAAPRVARFLMPLPLLVIGSCYVHCGSPQGIGSARTPFSPARVASWRSLRFQQIHCVTDCNKPIYMYVLYSCKCRLMYLCLLATIFYWFSFYQSSQTYTNTHAHTIIQRLCT